MCLLFLIFELLFFLILIKRKNRKNPRILEKTERLYFPQIIRQTPGRCVCGFIVFTKLLIRRRVLLRSIRINGMNLKAILKSNKFIMF